MLDDCYEEGWVRDGGMYNCHCSSVVMSRLEPIRAGAWPNNVVPVNDRLNGEPLIKIRYHLFGSKLAIV